MRLACLFSLDHRFLTIPPYPEMVLPSPENPNKIRFLSCVSPAVNEANAPLFTHFHLLLFPILLPKAIAMCCCVQRHKHVCPPPPPPRSPGLCLAPAFLDGDPLQTQPVLDPHPGSWLTRCPLSFTATFSRKLLSSPSSMGPPNAQRSSGFTLSRYINFGFEASRGQD